MKKYLAIYRVFFNTGFTEFPDDAVLPTQKEEIFADSIEDAKEKALAMQSNAKSGGRMLVLVSEFKEPTH